MKTFLKEEIYYLMLILFLLLLPSKQLPTGEVRMFSYFSAITFSSSIINTTHKYSHHQKYPQTILSGLTQTSLPLQGFPISGL